MSNATVQINSTLGTLIEVTKELIVGVDKEKFLNQFKGRHVAPGVSVRQHVNMMRITGSLDESDTRIKLKDGLI